MLSIILSLFIFCFLSIFLYVFHILSLVISIHPDVTEPLLIEIDQIYHLACPASPIFYKYNPVKVCIFYLLTIKLKEAFKSNLLTLNIFYFAYYFLSPKIFKNQTWSKRIDIFLFLLSVKAEMAVARGP